MINIHLQLTNRIEGDNVVGALPLAAEPNSFTSNPLSGLICTKETIRINMSKAKNMNTFMLFWSFLYASLCQQVNLQDWFANKNRKSRLCSQIKG